jgi:UPF0755 protein
MIKRFFAVFGGFAGFLAVLFLATALGGYAWARSYLFRPMNSADQSLVTFEVPKGANLESVSRRLFEHGYTNAWWSVYLIGKVQTMSKPEKPIKLIRGEYLISKSFTPRRLFDVITSGQVVTYEFMVPEGKNIREITEIVTKTGLVSAEDFKAALSDDDLMTQLELPFGTINFEGYLFPDTYRFSKPIEASEIVRAMVENGRARLDKDLPDWRTRAVRLKLSQHQLLTLASIIEKEAQIPSEREVISSVYHNRLRLGMRLQSDPTVIYGIENFNGNLTKDDLQRPSPYNTYVNVGLPPTPIANPGTASIAAALFPADTDFIYFVARGDGSHVFSATYKDHREAVRRYQLNAADTAGAAPAQNTPSPAPAG